jgi:diguanylate cyclase (GGDEF)-like protein
MANEMTYRATHDPLTGLINRVELEHSLEKALISAREHDIEHALMYIDLDQFKVVNDNCGHSAGDKLLTEITKVIRKCIRVTDTLARIGGDEFVVLLEECDKEPAMRLAQQVCDSVDQYRFHHDNQRFRIGASIGLVIVDSHWSSIATLLQAADSACYAAKEAGRNRVHLYFDSDYAMETRLGETKWVSRIEQAIEEQRFLLYCQRIFPLNGESKEHGEVLIRMQDDEGGLIAPSSFLPAAERFHIMTRIDRWVVATVFSWLKEHDGELDYIETLSINLSGQSLGDNTFHAYVLELIEVLAVDCTMLTFEITETVAINNFNEANKFIASMKKYGARFSLDDFGSGVSSFGYLKNLPVDYLKIDGQFIRHLTENQIDQATVRCIVEVAKCTQKKTIAEWVESEEVQTLLKQLGVDYCQGFYRHIPAPIDNLLEVKCTFVN